MGTPKPPANWYFLSGHKTTWVCNEIERKNLDPFYTEDMKDETSSFVTGLMDSGNRFERDEVLSSLQEAIPSNFLIDCDKPMNNAKRLSVAGLAREHTLVIFAGGRDKRSLNLREELTMELLKCPGKIRVLWNPRLASKYKDDKGNMVWGHRVAEPDLLYRQNVRTSAKPTWGAIDVKWHHPFSGTKRGITWKLSSLKSPYPDKSVEEAWVGTHHETDVLQLSHYYRALEFLGLAGKPIAGIIGKPLNGELRVVWQDLSENHYARDTKSALVMYDERFAERVAIVEREIARLDNPELDPLAGPEWKAACHECVWRSTCHAELTAGDHITLLPRVTPERAKAHYESGVYDVASLARLHTPTAKAVDAKVENLPELIAAAREYEGDPSDSPALLMDEATTKYRTSQCDRLAKAGVNTVGEVAALSDLTASYPLNVTNLVATIDQARVTAYARARNMTHVFLERGVTTLVIPRPMVEIHVDMENDALIYEWGTRVVWHARDSQGREKTTVTHRPSSVDDALVSFTGTEEGERDVFVAFWAYLQEVIGLSDEMYGPGNVQVFHYSPAEDRCMIYLAEKYEGQEGIPTIQEVKDFLASDMWVDLFPLLTKQLVWPTEDSTLKTLAKYIRFFWRDTDPSGANSVLWYHRAKDPTDPQRVAYQQRILDYNEDDCQATAELLSWLQRFDTVRDFGRKMAPVEDLEKHFSRPLIRRALTH
jgi:predicted RecB family nuclease